MDIFETAAPPNGPVQAGNEPIPILQPVQPVTPVVPTGTEGAAADEPERPRPPKLLDKAKFHPAPFVKYILEDDDPTRPWIASPVEAKSGMGIRLLRYKDGHYQPADWEFRQIALQLLDRKFHPAWAKEMQETAYQVAATPERKTNKQVEKYICVTNGLLDWRTGELRPHDPAFLRTWQIPVDWTPGATSEVLDRFLSTTLSPEDAQLFCEIAGYTLVPRNPQQALFFFIGGGANGKGVAINLLRGFLGEENTRSVSLTDLDPAQNRFMAAELYGSLANLVGDLGNVTIKDSAVLKKLTGGDALTAERKGQQPFEFIYQGKIIAACNEFPMVLDRSHGMMRRIVILPFLKTFDKDSRDRDPDLAEKLAHPEVHSAFLVKAIEGLRRLADSKDFTTSDSAIRAKVEYRRANDSAYDYAVTRLAFDNAQAYLFVYTVYRDYIDWCKEQGHVPVNNRQFNKTLDKVGAVRGHRPDTGGQRQRAWVGVKWKTDAEEDPDAEAEGGTVGPTPMVEREGAA